MHMSNKALKNVLKPRIGALGIDAMYILGNIFDRKIFQ